MKKRYQLVEIICIIAVVAVMIAIWYFTQVHGMGSITFVEEGSVVIEYGDSYDPNECIKEIDGALKQPVEIDTKKLGEQTLHFLVIKDGREKEFTYVVLVEDTKAPIIEVSEKEVTLAVNDDYDPNHYLVSVKDPVDGDLPQSDEKKRGAYWLSDDVDMSTEGDYTLTVLAMDQAENEAQETIKIHVTSHRNSLPAAHSYTGGYDSGADPYDCEPYYVNGILLVNKKHPLPPSFGGLDATAATALGELQAAALLDGFSLPTLSGYRSYEYQGTLYNNYVAIDGQEIADTYSARPGFSEHQSGMAFDVGAIDNNFGNTEAGIWLREHCHEYGFILRYPQGKEHITGYMYEPWHIRYVGVGSAREIHQRGITLEEYLGER